MSFRVNTPGADTGSRLHAVLAAGYAGNAGHATAAPPVPQATDVRLNDLSNPFRRKPKAPEPTTEQKIQEIRQFVASGQQHELRKAAEELLILEQRMSVAQEDSSTLTRRSIDTVFKMQVDWLYKMMQLKQRLDKDGKK